RNADDHEKNHALIVTDAQNYILSPAFDVLPTGQALGYQSMVVGSEGAVSSIENALSMASAYGLNHRQALTHVHGVV
ncbi:MAG: HipA domain-containing protein, partial [Pseudomonadota bacterium]